MLQKILKIDSFYSYFSKDFAFYLAKKGKIIIYKKGDLGCEFMYLNNHFSLGAFNVKSLKPFGAGDAFMGGFISSLSRKNNLKDSLIFGSACAALVVSKIGCSSAMPVFSEVKTFIPVSYTHLTLPTMIRV